MRKLLLLITPVVSLSLFAEGTAKDSTPSGDPLKCSYRHVSLGYSAGDHGYSAGTVDASVALGRVPYLFFQGTFAGKDDYSTSDNYLGLGIGFRINTGKVTALDIDLGYAFEKADGYPDNHMAFLGLGFRAAASNRLTIVTRARYFYSNITVYQNGIYANRFAELSIIPSFYINKNLSVDLNLTKYIYEFNDFRYGLSASYHF